jgi:PAS domain S-box-containing protein
MNTLLEEKKIYVVIVAVTFVLIILIATSIVHSRYRNVLKDTVNENRITANLLSSLVYEHQKAAISILESYAQRPLVAEAVAKKDFNHLVPHLQSLSKNHSEIDALFITDHSGTLWINYPVDRTAYGKNLAYRDWYKGVSKHWKPYVSTVYRLLVLDKGLAVAIAVPVIDKQDKVVGILAVAERAAFIAAFIKEKMIDPEKIVTLLDQEGNIIFSNAVPYEEKITKYPDVRLLEKATAGVVASLETDDTNQKGNISYVSIAPVKGSGWSIIVGQGRDTILRSLYGYFILAIATSVTTVLLISIGLVYFRREYLYRKTKMLRESEEKYRNLFDNALEGIYQSTLEGRFISVNKAFVRLFGYESPEQVISTVTDIGRQFYENPADRKRVVSIFRDEGIVKNFECRMRRKDGSIFWAYIDGRLSKTPDGTPCLEGFIVDITERKQAEEALKKSEEKYRSIIDNAAEGIYQSSPQGQFITANPAYARMLGYNSVGELMKTVTDIASQLYVDPGKHAELIHLITEHGSVSDFQLQLNRKDGNVIWASMNTRAVKDEGGNLLCLEGMVMDITMHKQAEDALCNSEKRYRRLFEAANDGIMIIDADTGRVVDVNPCLLQLLGCSHDAICGIHIWALSVFKDVAASEEAFRSLQENEHIHYDDLPLETMDGKSIEVEFVSAVFLVDHSKVIQCNIRDITARKRAEIENKRMMTAIRQVGEAIVMTDAQGDIRFVNPAFEQTTGYSHEEAVGQNSRILKSGRQDELFYRNLWDTISSGRTWKGRMVNKRKDGTLYTEEATISPVCNDLGRIVNYVAVKRDITEHLQLSVQLQQAQKMEAVGLLAGGVAHDYNNMLGVILGYTELALTRVDPAQPLHDDLEEIYRATIRSADITRQLLAFARKQTIVPVVLDLNQAVENMLRMIRRLIGENIDLAWLPGSGLYLVKMDPVQVGQILANLCVNARDAMTDVGKITIETGKAVFDAAYCSHHHGFVEGTYALLAISDSGCGMDKDILEHIFEPYFTSKDVGKGTGLGLSTVFGIVKQNKGFINVYSESGKGTTFRIYLPRQEGQAVDLEEKTVAEIPRGRGEILLVVEDEPALLTLAEMMLEELGYRVIAAGTPGEAIRLAKENVGEIRLLITDVVMPEMNGRELAENLQSLCPGLRILFMSGYTANVIAHQSVLDEGVNFVQKPFSMKELAVKVRQALDSE